ncbi:hypothetical protein BJX66DRAFT_270969 [Aspergillus keveii]|uniref:Uncharacterized protein n=1 Tax=Aspergillus keveii TaxID=714993 RepID=A0ABR4FX72_9EURO
MHNLAGGFEQTESKSSQKGRVVEEIPVPWFNAQTGGVMKTNEPTRCQLVVGASALDVAGLLAVVANPLTLGLCGAVARDVADFAAFVALLAVGAVTGHVAETAARVASLLAATEATTATTSETTSVATTLGAVSGNVTDAATLVTLLAASWAVVFTGLRAFAGDVTDTTATVA